MIPKKCARVNFGQGLAAVAARRGTPTTDRGAGPLEGDDDDGGVRAAPGAHVGQSRRTSRASPLLAELGRPAQPCVRGSLPAGVEEAVTGLERTADLVRELNEAINAMDEGGGPQQRPRLPLVDQLILALKLFSKGVLGNPMARAGYGSEFKARHRMVNPGNVWMTLNPNDDGNAWLRKIGKYPLRVPGTESTGADHVVAWLASDEDRRKRSAEATGDALSHACPAQPLHKAGLPLRDELSSGRTPVSGGGSAQRDCCQPLRC